MFNITKFKEKISLIFKKILPDYNFYEERIIEGFSENAIFLQIENIKQKIINNVVIDDKTHIDYKGKISGSIIIYTDPNSMQWNTELHEISITISNYFYYLINYGYKEFNLSSIAEDIFEYNIQDNILTINFGFDYIISMIYESEEISGILKELQLEVNINNG